jgi:FkbM family methyltransferase
MISYAQNCEDVILARVFDGRSDGFYVDVGAGDPVYFNVTKWFYDQGWSGLNIEPNARLFQKLLAERPRDVNLACGVGARRGEAMLFESRVPELSTFVQRRANDYRDEGQTRTVEIFPLTEIVDRYGQGRRIDFLKIDVEGWEREVLTGFDLRRFRPTVIVIEATIPQTRVRSSGDWEAILEGSDYCCVYFDGLNNFYVSRENRDLKRHFALPPNIFDDFKTDHLVQTETALAQTELALTRTQLALAQAQAELARAQASLANTNAAIMPLRRLLLDLSRTSIRKSACALRSDAYELRDGAHDEPRLNSALAEAVRILRSRKASLFHVIALNRAWLARFL